MTTDSSMTSPQMERIMQQLAQTHGVDLSRKGAFLSLAMPSRPDRWLIANLDGQRLSVTHCWVEAGDCLAPDLDMVFGLHLEGWEPIELLHSDELWDTYVQAAKATGVPVYDEQGDVYFAHFTEYWAQQIEAQGWLMQSRNLAKTSSWHEQTASLAAAAVMAQFVHDLFEHYEAEVLPSGLLYLELTMDRHGALILEERIKHRQKRVCYWLFDSADNPVPEPEILFYIAPSGHWIPYEIHRHTAGHYSYADLEMAQAELILTDPKSQAALAYFTDFWADILRAQGWVDGASKCITQPRAWLEDEELPEQPPTVEDLRDWVDEYGLCTAIDGCWVDPQGMCEHGFPSWLVALGLL